MTQPEHYRLDQALADEPGERASGLGVGTALLPLGAFVAILFVLGGLASAVGLPDFVFSLLAYAILAGVVVVAARQAVDRLGGWERALGWGPLRRSDVGPVLLWTLFAFVGRYAATVVVVDLIPGLRHQDTSNVDFHGLGAWTVIASVLVVVVVAPPIEELIYRGLLLRAFMRRVGFWPAALASSLLFGLSHSWQESTLAGALLIVVNTAVFGLLQCMYVRRTARIGPAAVVHGVSNALAAAVAIAAAALLG